jgi:hypothetical protein
MNAFHYVSALDYGGLLAAGKYRPRSSHHIWYIREVNREWQSAQDFVAGLHYNQEPVAALPATEL